MSAGERGVGDRLYHDLQAFLVGLPLADVVDALQTAFLVGIVTASESVDHADVIIDNVAAEMKREARLNWDGVKKAAAKTVAAAGRRQ